MSPHGFSVDLGALGAVSDRIGRLAEELTGLPRDVPKAEVFGHGRLAEAASEFATREKRGLARLASEAESIRQGLAETIKTYQKVDEDGAGRFGDIAS